MEYITINIIGLFVDIFLIFLVCFNNYISYKKKKVFIVSAALLALITVFAFIQSICYEFNPKKTYVLLNILNAVIFSITPVLPVLLAFPYMRLNKKRISLLAIPFIANVIINFISIFVPLVFHFTIKGKYVFGPLYLFPTIIAFISLIIAIINLIKLVNYGSNMELFFIIGIYLVSAFTYGLEFLLNIRGLFFCMLSVCELAYFTMVTMLDVRKDSLATTYNRAYFESYTKSLDGTRDALIIMYDINGLKKMNDVYGHREGDKLIETVGTTLLSVYGKFGKVFRYGGDEFFVIIQNEFSMEVYSLNKKVTALLSKDNITTAYGFTIYRKTEAISDAIKRVDNLMYDNKKRTYEEIK